MKEYYKDQTARVYFDPELDTLFLEYTGKVQNDQHFVTINQAVLDAFLELNTRKFVADIRRMGIISVNSQKWVIEVLLPGMTKHLNGRKLFHAQFLDPSEIFSKVSGANIKNNSKKVEEDFEVMQFSDADEMKAYLKKLEG